LGFFFFFLPFPPTVRNFSSQYLQVIMILKPGPIRGEQLMHWTAGLPCRGSQQAESSCKKSHKGKGKLFHVRIVLGPLYRKDFDKLERGQWRATAIVRSWSTQCTGWICVGWREG